MPRTVEGNATNRFKRNPRKSLRILQTNLGRETAAHDIAFATVAEYNIDLLIVGEPNKTIIKTQKWISDKRGDVAVYFRNREVTVKDIKYYDGFLGLHLEFCTLYCCYISPNIPINEFQDLVDKIISEIVTSRRECVLLGDINAKSVEWGSPFTDSRGTYFSECLAAANMVVHNTGDNPTFVRGSTESYIT
ncbi:unnamed protein product [Acanthoscelides obtectus]|uniref:Endonuclease/exonuclease/phosphatase domain-containing protein n=1 Tax=Acanthoscelides obtectus TaxID=200917 RepID=A0A9P0Q4A3_ACAOB|nr:unnamed protein product [Acanthoscelides obtectus]CAK1635355.1 hypothetical protein AOBTE_LOCUS9227 [Acanthoscelides obtectus]